MKIASLATSSALAMFALVRGSVACGGDGAASADGGPEAAAVAMDVCDAFSGVGTSCPLASPNLCFPMCEAGGCLCGETPSGPRWSCVTDRSCMPTCAPIDDACAADGGDAPSE